MTPFLQRVFQPADGSDESTIHRLGLGYSILLLESADADGEFDQPLKKNLLQTMIKRYGLNTKESSELNALFLAKNHSPLNVWVLSQDIRQGIDHMVKWKILDEVWHVFKRAHTPDSLEDYITQKLGLLLGVSMSEAAESRVRVETGLDAL